MVLRVRGTGEANRPDPRPARILWRGNGRPSRRRSAEPPHPDRTDPAFVGVSPTTSVSAGLAHALYGTAGFAVELLPRSSRPIAQAVSGEAAEALVYRYCSCDRDANVRGARLPARRVHRPLLRSDGGRRRRRTDTRSRRSRSRTSSISFERGRSTRRRSCWSTSCSPRSRRSRPRRQTRPAARCASATSVRRTVASFGDARQQRREAASARRHRDGDRTNTRSAST